MRLPNTNTDQQKYIEIDKNWNSSDMMKMCALAACVYVCVAKIAKIISGNIWLLLLLPLLLWIEIDNSCREFVYGILFCSVYLIWNSMIVSLSIN